MSGSQRLRNDRDWFVVGALVWGFLLLVTLASYRVAYSEGAGGSDIAEPLNIAQIAVGHGPEPYLSAGTYHTCGMRVDGSVDCWGSNDYGQATDQPGPYVQVSVGGQHSCALRADGSVNCWGRNHKGQADDQPGPFTQIEAGMFHTCGLRPNGAADCWGSNDWGEAEDQPGPFSQISAGYGNTFGLRQDGGVTGWGDAEGGDQSGPFTQLAAGWAHTCALTPGGAADCFGNDNYGVATDQPGPFIQLSSNAYVTCGLRPDGGVKCWGKDPWITDGHFTQISVGIYHACGLKPDGNVACWGANWLGQAPSLVTGPFGSYHTPPTAADDAYSTDEEQPLQVSAPGVLANDSSAYGSPLTAALFRTAAHGTLSLNLDGSFSYTPALDFSGVDDFAYTTNDGQADSKVATVTITVRNTNDAPVASALEISILENERAAIQLAATDPDGDALTYTIVTNPQHGALSGAAPGLTYTPTHSYFGSDSFTYKASDGTADSNVAAVTISIAPVLNHDLFQNLPPASTNVPLASDASFVTGSGPTMNRYLFKDQGPIEFTIAIDRVVGRTDKDGYLLEPQKLIDQGIVPPTVNLFIGAYDVDDKYSGTDVAPENDKVFVNGREAGKLTGSDGKWRASYIAVDVRHIKFGIPTCQEYDGVNPPAYLSQCSSPPAAGQNTIRIDIDADNPGWTWATAVDWAQISFEAARPILFVHGRGGSSAGKDPCSVLGAGDGCDYWDKFDGAYYFGFRDLLNQAGFLTAITENFLGGETSISENAVRLIPVLLDVLDRYGVDKINIVAHSKGGLDSRNLLLYTPWGVQTLITLASPHHGSYLGDLGSHIPEGVKIFNRENTDAMKNLSEKYMEGTFNPFFSAVSGVHYYSIFASAATTCAATVWVPNPGLYPPLIPVTVTWRCADNGQQSAIPPDKAGGEGIAFQILDKSGKYRGENDFLVTTRSARLIGLPGHTSSNTTEFGPYFLNHHSIRAAMSAVGIKDTQIADLVGDLLDIRHDTIARSAPRLAEQTDSVALSTEASGLGVESGTIAAGATFNQPVGVDTETDMSFFLLWERGDLTLNLVEPDGTVITQATEDTRYSYSEDRSGSSIDALNATGKWAAYHVTAPVKGQWQVQIAAAQQIPEGLTDWLLLVPQERDVTVTIAPDAPWKALDGTVKLGAEVKAAGTPIPGATVVGRVIRPDESIAEIPLYDDGAHNDGAAADGVYGNSFVGTQFGIYGLSAKASGIWEGVTFSEVAVNEVQIASGTAVLSGTFSDDGLDMNDDSRFDFVRIEVPLKVTSAGEYSVFGELRSISGELLATASAASEFAAGQRTLNLDFGGDALWSNNASGQFKLTNLTLMDMSSVELPVRIDFKETAYTTKPYKHEDFQHAAIVLTGKMNDYGVDTNDNGKFDQLVVEAEVFLDIGGDYAWEARLIDGDGFDLGSVSGEAALPTGSTTLAFAFDGNAIGASRHSGPYFLVDLALWGDGGSLNAIDVAQTQAYYYRLFESAPPGGDLYLPAVLH